MNEDLILVVEDDPGQREQLVGFLKSLGVATRSAGDADAAREVLSKERVDLVITDLRLPGDSGIELLRSVREADPEVDFIVVTAHGSVEAAVEAIRHGADDFLTKPVDLDVLEFRVRRVLDRRRMSREVESLRDRLRARVDVEGLVAESPAMQEVLSVALKVAPTDSTVLLTGESGTGKERIAEVIHAKSPRADRPYVRVNCAALPENLLETELFGHVKGAFTGAHRDRTGCFEEADGGTILLDEMGEMTPAMQVKLLRVLQEREIVRVGDNAPRPVDVRILAATNRDLPAEVEAGRFREDLYYRIQVIALRIPPLRDRPEDTAALLPKLVERFRTEAGIGERRISPDAHGVLLRYSWPGNVRELMNVVQRAVILAPGETIGIEDLPDQVVRPPRAEIDLDPLEGRTLPELVEEIERRAIRRALTRERGVKARAARSLGLQERVLRYKIEKYGIDLTEPGS